jgi:hypothetical protein
MNRVLDRYGTGPDSEDRNKGPYFYGDRDGIDWRRRYYIGCIGMGDVYHYSANERLWHIPAIVGRIRWATDRKQLSQRPRPWRRTPGSSLLTSARCGAWAGAQRSA